MNDRSWLLNTSAISCAKTCIKIVQREFGVKLTLSEPRFLEIVEKVNGHLDSPDLDAAYKQLIEFEAHAHKTTPTEQLHALGSSLHDTYASIREKIEFHGKEYPRFDETGKEFKGVYRGNARYG